MIFFSIHSWFPGPRKPDRPFRPAEPDSPFPKPDWDFDEEDEQYEICHM